jgi:hypothetical protein
MGIRRFFVVAEAKFRETDRLMREAWPEVLASGHGSRGTGGFPSGQRGQTVNLMALPSQVRILYPPF